MSESDIYGCGNLSENLPGKGFSLEEKKQPPKRSFAPRDKSPNADSSDLPLEAPTAPPTQAPTEDSTWTTVNLPNAISVDDLAVAPEEDIYQPPEANDSLPPGYLMQTIAQCIEAQKLVASMEPEQSACGEAELWARVEYLENLLSQYRDLLEEQQLQAATQQAELEAKIRALEQAQAQINHLTAELAVCQETIHHQQQEIAELTKNWQQCEAHLAQLERECATTQQRYKEQVHLNIEAANTCRELRARLNRQQRQTLQFKAALEKSLANQGSGGALVTENSGTVDMVSDRTEDLIELSPGGVVPKSVPIQPWYTNSSKTSVFELAEKREHIMTEKPESPEPFSPGAEPSPNLLESGNSVSLPIVHPRRETVWPEPDNLMETIRTMVTPEPFMSSVPTISPPLLPQEQPDADLLSFAPQNNLANSLADADTQFQSKSEPDAGNSNTDLPEMLELAATLKPPAPEIRPPKVEPTQNWPAPVVYPERSQKRRSLSAVELPNFRTK